MTTEVKDWMNRIIDYYPKNKFTGFEPEQMQAIFTKGKKGKKGKLSRVVPIKYPYDVLIKDKVYIIEVKEGIWRTLTDRKKWLAVLHIMCHIPEGGFDEMSKEYGKKKKPDYEMFKAEFEASNGHPNWLEDDSKIQNLPVGSEISEPAESEEEELVAAE